MVSVNVGRSDVRQGRFSRSLQDRLWSAEGCYWGYKLEAKNSAVHNVLFLLRYEINQQNVSGERLPQRGAKITPLFHFHVWTFETGFKPC